MNDKTQQPSGATVKHTAGPTQARSLGGKGKANMKIMSQIKVEAVNIEVVQDESPDTSYLGEYSNTPKAGAIDREARGDMGRNEMRYFIPAMTGEESGNPESPEQDYKRMESLNAGNWCYVGVIAKAVIRMPSGTSQTIRSGGLWGIESDCGDYIKEVAGEQLAELRAELVALGVGDRAAAYAVKHAETVNK